jgi:hypothetical protein
MKKMHHPMLEDTKKPFCGIAGKKLRVAYEKTTCKRCKLSIEVAIREELKQQEKEKSISSL